MAIKQINFYLRWQEAQRAEKHAVRQTRLRWVAPAAALVTVLPLTVKLILPLVTVPELSL